MGGFWGGEKGIKKDGDQFELMGDGVLIKDMDDGRFLEI